MSYSEFDLKVKSQGFTFTEKGDGGDEFYYLYSKIIKQKNLMYSDALLYRISENNNEVIVEYRTAKHDLFAIYAEELKGNSMNESACYVKNKKDEIHVCYENEKYILRILKNPDIHSAIIFKRHH